MRYLDFINKRLAYGQEILMPFYLLHLPVIVTIVLYVVQWNAGIPVKLPVVILGSVVVTLGLSEMARYITPIRALFGMKPRNMSRAVR